MQKKRNRKSKHESKQMSDEERARKRIEKNSSCTDRQFKHTAVANALYTNERTNEKNCIIFCVCTITIFGRCEWTNGRVVRQKRKNLEKNERQVNRGKCDSNFFSLFSVDLQDYQTNTYTKTTKTTKNSHSSSANDLKNCTFRWIAFNKQSVISRLTIVCESIKWRLMILICLSFLLIRSAVECVFVYVCLGRRLMNVVFK